MEFKPDEKIYVLRYRRDNLECEKRFATLNGAAQHGSEMISKGYTVHYLASYKLEWITSDPSKLEL